MKGFEGVQRELDAYTSKGAPGEETQKFFGMKYQNNKVHIKVTY